MVFVTAKQQQQPEQCCHLQLLHGPITAGTIPNEDTAFITCVDPISPPQSYLSCRGCWRERYGGGAGYRPRVRSAYFTACLSL